MEEIKKQINKEQIITLTNKSNLIVGGTNKIISLKPELIQLDTIFGGLQITGQKLELIKLDNNSLKAEINGEINSIKFINTNNTPFFRKIFK